MHSNPKICSAACRFFLVLDYEMEHTDEEYSSDQEEAISMLKKQKQSKLTKDKKKYLERAIKTQKRKARRKNRVQVRTDFLPIDTLYDPLSYVEKLFAKLKKSNDKYEVKLLMLRLVSRLIGRHRLILL